MNYTTDLDYISGQTIIPEGAFGVSPSSISKFMESPHIWYREMILGEKQFDQSTSTILGTLTHYCAEQYAKHSEVNYIEIYKYIIKNVCLEPEEAFELLSSITKETFDEEAVVDWIENSALNPDFNVEAILSEWRPMGQALIDHIIKEGLPSEVEPLVKAEIQPGYWAAGSIDAIKGVTFLKGDTQISMDEYLTLRQEDPSLVTCKGSGTIVDYKTTSTKTPKDYIPMAYKYQLLTYAWICKQNGIPIDRIQITWITRHDVNRISEKTGKPIKSYPATVTTVPEQITDSDFDFIESILSMIVDTVKAGKDYPELLHVLFKDPRLKQ